jgi:hypothetical protein
MPRSPVEPHSTAAYLRKHWTSTFIVRVPQEVSHSSFRPVDTATGTHPHHLGSHTTCTHDTTYVKRLQVQMTDKSNTKTGNTVYKMAWNIFWLRVTALRTLHKTRLNIFKWTGCDGLQIRQWTLIQKVLCLITSQVCMQIFSSQPSPSQWQHYDEVKYTRPPSGSEPS